MGVTDLAKKHLKAARDSAVRDWRRPSVPIEVEDGEFATGETGRATLDYKARFTPEEIERRKHGYVCINCWEPHEQAFPEKCQLCGFPMQRLQRQVFDMQFQGNERARWVERIEEELEKLEDTHERNFHTTKTGIIVPRRVR